MVQKNQTMRSEKWKQGRILSKYGFLVVRLLFSISQKSEKGAWSLKNSTSTKDRAKYRKVRALLPPHRAIETFWAKWPTLEKMRNKIIACYYSKFSFPALAFLKENFVIVFWCKFCGRCLFAVYDQKCLLVCQGCHMMSDTLWFISWWKTWEAVEHEKDV